MRTGLTQREPFQATLRVHQLHPQVRPPAMHPTITNSIVDEKVNTMADNICCTNYSPLALLSVDSRLCADKPSRSSETGEIVAAHYPLVAELHQTWQHHTTIRNLRLTKPATNIMIRLSRLNDLHAHRNRRALSFKKPEVGYCAVTGFLKLKNYQLPEIVESLAGLHLQRILT